MKLPNCKRYSIPQVKAQIEGNTIRRDAIEWYVALFTR